MGRKMTDRLQILAVEALSYIGNKLDDWHWKFLRAAAWMERFNKTCKDCDHWHKKTALDAHGTCAFHVITFDDGLPCCEFEKKIK